MERKIIIYSLILLGSYIAARLASGMLLSFVPSPIVLFNIWGKHIVFALIIVMAIFTYSRRRFNLYTIVLLLMSIGGYGFDFLYRKAHNDLDLVIYRDGVASSIDIEFYKNANFRLIISSILGDTIFRGKYQRKADVIKIEDIPESILKGCNEFIIKEKNVICVLDERVQFYVLDNTNGLPEY